MYFPLFASQGGKACSLPSMIIVFKGQDLF
jgi:hypothetical protein